MESAVAFFLLLCLIGVVALGALLALRQMQKMFLARRAAFISRYAFAPGTGAKLLARHPHLRTEDLKAVEDALRTFFLCYLRSGFRQIGMPSRVVDDLWHEFILDTKAYSAFCRQAFGRFLHHTPSGGMGRGQEQDAALRRTWRLACRHERISSTRAKQLPSLFSIDKRLAVAGALVYSLHWPVSSEERKQQGCGGGACGGGGLATGSGCSGGCSGGGCGGGCGGGS
jgi:hypothetical protein